jgi:hypothetical protein
VVKGNGMLGVKQQAGNVLNAPKLREDKRSKYA